jgi:uncharacterized protein (DUF924 family)
MASAAVSNAITTPLRRALHRERAEAVLNFWFGSFTAPQANYDLWFGGSAEIDADVKTRFQDDVNRAEAGEYVSWLAEPLTALALCITLDQFPLNIYRDQPKGYELSASAIPYAYTAIGRGFDKVVDEKMKMFFYLPLMHSEHEVDQKRCVELMNGDSFAVDHQTVVSKYGRFPGRNHVMGRESTAEEQEYLKNGGAF